MRPTITVSAAAAVLALTLTGCGGATDAGPAPTSATTQEPTVTPEPSPPVEAEQPRKDTTPPAAPADAPPEDTTPSVAPIPEVTPDAPTEEQVVPLPTDAAAPPFTYDEAYAAWQGGMAYYDAFCVNYTPTTAAGVSQCDGIEAGTVDGITGEYIGAVDPPGVLPGPGVTPPEIPGLVSDGTGCYYYPDGTLHGCA